MQKLLMLKGLPASGKSTLAKKLVSDSKGQMKRVNKDDLRSMIDNGAWSKEREKMIVNSRNALIDLYLAAGFSVVVDDTNFHKPHEDYFRETAAKHKVKFESQMVECDVDECIKRDLKRENSVGEKVIRDMYNRYVRKFKEGEYIQQDILLPRVYLFDIDGTIAIRGDRSPYNMDRVGEDTSNYPVMKLIFDLTKNVNFGTLLKESSDKFGIVFVSARNECAREKTEQWIYDRTGFKYPKLFLRADGDNRRDSVVKREIYENHIKNKYYVTAVFDDREQVVKECWRDIGLPCFQVAEGKF